jgi:flagellar L-ring protein precursor FlgH
VRIALLCGVVVAGVVLALPAHARKKIDPHAQYAASYAPPAPMQIADGAIFHASAGYAALTSGTRASMVGDILTITLVERTQALKSNSASTDRNGSIELTPPTTGPLDFIKPTDLALSGGGKFDGKGAAAQSNQLSGEISVTVSEVYPNGNLLVKGEKLLTLNRGDEHIRISGIVRPADIGFDNRVSSTRVADAHITYSGNGEIARASSQGWLGRFFSRVSPF